VWYGVGVCTEWMGFGVCCSFVDAGLVAAILEGYSLPVLGLHGISHWGRVLSIGRRIAGLNGADPAVVEYFAVFHDSRRINEGIDHGHGARGAELAEAFRSRLRLTDEQLATLMHACRHHTDGTIDGDVTVRTCWDADRLDLLRVGIRPSRTLLCTVAGKSEELRDWAMRRSVEEHVPECVGEWLQA